MIFMYYEIPFRDKFVYLLLLIFAYIFYGNIMQDGRDHFLIKFFANIGFYRER